MPKTRKKLKERYCSYETYAPGTLKLRDVNLVARVTDDAAYDKELKALQLELLGLQIAYFQSGRRAIFAFEGWDASGKGGVIQRLTALLDPRGYKVWPIAAPRDEEQRQHYLWRFWKRLPEKGELALFDRTWYGRVLVERVERFASEHEWHRAYGEINAFETMLTNDGIKLAKFWIHIDRKTQLERFRARESDPFKKYKIGPDDWRNRKKWGDYEAAIEEMLDQTHRPDAKWHLIPGNDKKSARLAVLRDCVKLLKKD